ncbi:winged helix-turn-helix domain-containing protein [Halosolutus halophilus]|uniref:winged helix-turn-helix domain-containing protein n=1 Tax=Halosolutus halophilus TaxID=1552990 RepID=UPI0022350B98|nr:helix-turn-helix domain-containing protein [Halosolutus halophilus]
MSETADNRPRCTYAEQDGPMGCDPHSIIELLAAGDTRDVYLRAEEPVTVREIAEELDLPRSTAYRKVERLQEAGLLRQLNERSKGGLPAHYVQSMDAVSVTYDDPVQIECSRNGATLWCEPE